MRRNLLAAGAAALALLTPWAWADPTSTLVVKGSGLYFFYGGIPGPCDVGTPDFPYCEASEAPVTWAGVLRLVTVSAADGTYTGASLEAINFTANIGGFNYKYGDQQQECIDDACMNAYLGMDPTSSVTIKDGQVTSLDIDWTFENGAFLGGPLVAGSIAVSENPGGGGHASDGWWVTGSATQVPEPAMMAMTLIGLGLVWTQRRKVKTARGS